MSNVLNKADLHKFIQNGQNAIISGPHGIGKTAIIKEVCEEAGLRWKYFSCANLDPFVDIIGVPRAGKLEESGNQYLEMIMPKDFAEDTIDFIFLDEFNRASEKVINAMMELIQFRQMSGKKFTNLKAIFAAVNPFDEDETYAVNRLDPAVLDRFQIHINIRQDYIDTTYFNEKYPTLAKPFISWFKDNENYRFVSPRRLEYAINAYQSDINLDYVLPVKSNVVALKEAIKQAFRPEEKAKKIDFTVKEDGNYTIEEALHALENKIPISINLNQSMSMIDVLIKDKSLFGILNYIHPEILFDAFKQTKSRDFALGRKYTWEFIINHDEKLNTVGEIPEDILKFMQFTIKADVWSNERPPLITNTKFYKKYLKKITLN